jgi:hypothetical protein
LAVRTTYAVRHERAAANRVRGLTSGGIGAMQLVAQSTGLVTAIDQHVQC